MSDIKDQEPRIEISTVPHSGNLGLEFPPQPGFDKTPLGSAVDQGLIVTPEDVSTLPSETVDYEPTEEEIQEALAELVEEEGEKRARIVKWLARVGITVLAIGGIGAAAFGIMNSNNGEGNTLPEDDQPVAEEQGTPVTPEVKVPTLESLEIPAGLGPEATAKAITDLQSRWGMAGADREHSEARLMGENGFMSLSEYVDKVVEANAAVYAPAVYGPNWADPKFAEAIKLDKDYNRQILTANYQTYGTNSIAPYSQELVLVSSTYVDNGNGTFTYEVLGERKDNSDQNIVPDVPKGRTQTAVYVAGELDGHVYLVEPVTYK